MSHYNYEGTSEVQDVTKLCDNFVGHIKNNCVRLLSRLTLKLDSNRS